MISPHIREPPDKERSLQPWLQRGKIFWHKNPDCLLRLHNVLPVPLPLCHFDGLFRLLAFCYDLSNFQPLRNLILMTFECLLNTAQPFVLILQKTFYFWKPNFVDLDFFPTFSVLTSPQHINKPFIRVATSQSKCLIVPHVWQYFLVKVILIKF